MPSPYSPPDVIVTQKRRTVLADRTLPQLPVVIIGPARQIEYRALAGLYTSGDAFQAAVPNLQPGAIIDQTSLHFYLNATSAGGKKLGLFEIAAPDAELSPDGTLITLAPTFALAFSLLSSRNNNEPDSSTDNDYSAGTPDAITFTDDAVDFLSRGATAGDTDVVINSPASMVGTYRVTALVGSGQGVNTLKVEQLSNPATGAKVLQKTFDITAGGIANVNGTAVINGSDTDAAGSDVGLVAPGGTVGTIANADYPQAPFFAVPDLDSADQVTLSMSGQPTNVQNAWNAIVAAASVNDFLRIANDATVAVNGDFRIVGVNKTANTLTIVRPDQTATGTATAAGSGTATMSLLRVLRGRSDQNNAAGDVLVMTIGGVATEFEVDRATPKRITLISAITGLVGATTVTARRGVPFRNSVASYDLVKRLTSGYSGNVLVSYEADRKDLSVSGLIPIANQTDIANDLGVVHPNNPLAFGADMVTRSGFTDGTRTFYALATDGDTLADFQAALDTLETEDVYYIVPLTQDPAIISLFKAHVDAQSQPLNKHERVVLVNTALTTVRQVVPATGTLWPSDGIIGTSGNLARFDSAGINWGLVAPGDVVKVLASAAANAAVIEERRIFTVDAANKRCTVIGNFSSDYSGNAQIFRIDSFPFTKMEQAEEWRDYAKSLADSRVVVVRPDAVEVTYTDTTQGAPKDNDIIVPGYYLAAVFAGLCASLSPQQPMTNVPLPGINRVYDSNTYFTPDQLNTIAEGGNAIFVQDNVEGAPYCRHQLTSDMTSILTREFSIVKNVDFASKFVRRSLRPYIGNKNITEEYLTQLRGICESLIRALVQAESMLQGSSLEKLYQNPDEPDSVIVEIGLKVPYPANKIYVTLFI